MPEKIYYGVCTRKGVRKDGYEGACPIAFWMTKPYFTSKPTKCVVCEAKLITKSKMQPTPKEWVAMLPPCYTPLEFEPQLCNRMGQPDEGQSCDYCIEKWDLTDAL